MNLVSGKFYEKVNARANSVMVQPSDQMSAAQSYYFSSRQTSGALYQRVPMWLLRQRFFCVALPRRLSKLAVICSLNRFSSASPRNFFYRIALRTRFVLPLDSPVQAWGSERASPKSHMRTSHRSFMSIFDGFRSRWIILAECMNFKAQSRLYISVLRWFSFNVRLDVISITERMSMPK